MSDLGHALIEIDILIAHIEAIGAIKVQPIIAKAMLEHVTNTIAAGTDANGASWAKTKTGQMPLAHAAKHLQVYSTPSVAGISIQGSTEREIEGRHHFGRVKGKIARPIIPTRLIPIKLATLIKVRLTEAFETTAHGRHRNSA